jgi:CheY-like chemotaxis protein
MVKAARETVRVLIADDNADLRLMIDHILTGAGYETEVAGDGGSAFEIHCRRPADVLITDIFMPEADGLETIRLFRTRYPDMGIIAISGGGRKAHGDYLKLAAEIGADATLHKPFDSNTLLDTLQQVLRR